MSGITITAAIIAALCAVTLLVFAGGKDQRNPAPAAAPDPQISACQAGAGIDCVQAAKDAVSGSSQAPADPTATGLP